MKIGKFGNRHYLDKQCAILKRCQSEKRSLNKEDVEEMNTAVRNFYLENLCSGDTVDNEDEKRSDDNNKEDETTVKTEDKENQETDKEEKSCGQQEEKRADENKEDNSKENESDDDNKESETDSEKTDDETEKVDDKEDDKETKSDDEDTKENDENKKENRGINTNMKQEFSILKAINAIVNNRNLDEVASAVKEKGLAEMRKSGLNYGGQIQLPVQELRSVTVSTEHDDVVATDLYDILEPLYAKNVLVQAGAKFMSGLVGDIQVPTMSAGSVTWEGETATAKESEYTFSSVKLSPKRLTAYVDISKQFIVQDSKGAEAMIRADIVKALNAKLEATILGDLAGTTTQPGGIFADATLDTVTSYQDICDLECKLEDANVFSDMKYIMSNKAKAALRGMAKSEHNQYVLEGTTVDGTPYLNTSHIEGKKVVYGDFSNLAIGQWGAIDIVVDPYTKAADGMIRIVINSYWDAKVLRPEAFAYATVGE